MLKLAAFVSGGGSNFGAVLEAIDKKNIAAEVKIVIASKPGIYAIERAKAHNIPTFVFQKSAYGNLDEMFFEIDKALQSADVDLIALLGYLTVLPKSFVKKYENKIINIHPSLIPNYCGDGFYGHKVHEAVIAAGEKFSGATVHFVDEGTDTGAIILQREVPVLVTDSADDLAARVLETEHEIIVEAIAHLAKQKL